MNRSEHYRLALAQSIFDAADGDVIWIRSPKELRIITVTIKPEDKKPTTSKPSFVIWDELEAEVTQHPVPEVLEHE